ncbi:LysR family transcriptional regulator [Comamonas piscis]|uniref:LysR family transcriptional regulator n=1 Tax=Comamonas piscis TaxID=1562974 RepID=A0A7G5ECZ9_9BURK|nr:LysR family transcriptional regulator [Comamonas piscis]QMV71874.1 LysR family transcriptional regulator [Comamonas piscis]WSO34610.1 LysR family transcriptional regulator [Comamonas piscis]
MTHVFQPQRSAPIPTLRQLSCFKQAAEHPTFTQAAESLEMSQPAFSSAIRELEITLGATLFDRSMRRVRLTPAGESVRAQVSWMIATFDQGMDDMLQRLQHRSHVIRIHCIPSALQWIAPYMAKFQAHYPEVQFQMDDMHSDTLAQSITQGDADIAVGLHFDTPAHIDSRLIATDEILVAVSERHPLAQHATLYWRDLKDQSLVVLRRGSTYEMIAATLKAQGVNMNTPQNLWSIESLYAVVHNDLKVGVISSLNKQALADPQLCYLPVSRPHLARKICLMKHGKRADTPLLVQSFWDLLCDTL